MTVVFIAALGMLTFLYRFTPLLLDRKSGLTGQKRRFLDHCPLAILSAMIVPGVIQVDAVSPMVGVCAGAAAILLSCFHKMPLFAVIMASVGLAVIVKMLGG